MSNHPQVQDLKSWKKNYAFMHSYEQQDIRDGLHVCLQILEKMQIIKGSASESISHKAITLGERFAIVIIETLKEWDFNEEEELFLPEEDIPGEDVTGEQSHASSSSSPEKTSVVSLTTSSTSQTTDHSEDDFEPLCKKQKSDYIPLETKIKILNMVREHPKWSLKTVQKHGGSALKNKSDLKKWKDQIEKGYGAKEKYEMINKWTFDRFVEARQQMQPISTKIIQQWASQAALQYQGPDFSFTASHGWIIKFKAFYSIRQRKITRYLKSKHALNLSTILKEAEKFQKRLAKKIAYFPLDYVINTDQTGCEYRVDVRRTLTTKGQKIVDVFLGDFNKVTHSYTAQYALTASGKLLPKVFLCMQEPKGIFGPHVSNTVEKLTKNYGNVIVTASKSGKLTKDHFHSFVENIIKDYCKQEEFLLILDSWGGQTDMAYFKMFLLMTKEIATAMLKLFLLIALRIANRVMFTFSDRSRILSKSCKILQKYCKISGN